MSVFPLLLMGLLPAADGAVPMTGKAEPAWKAIDDLMLKTMKTLNATAASATLVRNGRLIFVRGYGWKDEAKKVPTPPDAIFGIASLSKMITHAGIRAAIREEHLDIEERAFDLVKIRPPDGLLADERIKKITIRHLLEHRGGWDKKDGFDLAFRPREITRKFKLSGPPTPDDLIAWGLTHKLNFEPGEKEAYSNFGYVVLGRVLEAVEKKPYLEALQSLVFKPARITDVHLARTDPKDRHPRQVWSPADERGIQYEMIDAAGGLAASAPALARFLDYYWLNGEIKHAGEWGNYVGYGSLPATTALLMQRRDGLGVVMLFNSRRNDKIEDDQKALKKELDELLDAMTKK